jgi:hypothetical protein
LEVYEGGAMEFVHEFDDSGELRDVVATIALTRDIESTTLVFREPLQPVEEEDKSVLSRPLVTHIVIVILVIARVGEANTGRRLQEDHVSHYTSNQFSV